MMYGSHGFGMWGLLLVLLGTLLLGGLVVVGGVVLMLLLRGPGSPGKRTDDASSAHQVLSRRFAEGEIDENEYERRSRALDARHPRRPGT